MNDSSLRSALDALDGVADTPSKLCLPFLRLLPVSGASVSTVGDLLGSETISASDDLAARVDELQFDLGEGPCWDAMTRGLPVLEPDLAGAPRTVWPAFSAAIREHPVSSLFAFPLSVGPLRIGAVDLYSGDLVELDAHQARQASTVAAAVSRHVLRHALEAAGAEPDDAGSPRSRRLVHQATGLVLAQLRIPGPDARLIIQSHAYTTDRSMMEVAREIVDGRLSFSHGAEGIEVSE